MRTTAIVLTAGTIGLLGFTSKDQPKTVLLGASSTVITAADACDRGQLNRAITHYRNAYARAREQMRAIGPVPRHWYRNCVTLQRRAVEWRDRAIETQWLARSWHQWHYNWKLWLPSNWYQVGRCETGYGGHPNFHHQNSRFVSAFGISRAIYNRDAAHAGMPPWNDTQPPTPWQQYMTALGHYDLFGDGWTCPGP